ncbi:MAG TPA: hypothetical protein VJ813_10330 [Vicinamibacterales bacterium]|nr:hypothetical protein [Vicinamibacterales bacterium]
MRPTRRRARVLALIVMLGCAPAAAGAQVYVGSDKPRRGSVEVAGGGLWTGSQDLPPSAALLTVNPSAGLSSFEQFTSESSIGAALGLHGAVAVYVTRSVAIEGGLQLSRPQLKVRLADDVEDAPDVTATTTMTAYLFTGSVLYHFGGSGRTVPFIAAGAGHIRDVHSGSELVETGLEYHGKAGVKMWFGTLRRFGLRAEGGLSVRDGGFSYDDDRRIAPTAAVSLLYLF